MKSILLALALALAHPVCAQETTDLEAGQKAARKLKSALGTLTDAPLAIIADEEKPSLVKVGDDSGILFMPDQRLTEETLAGSGSTIAPLGQLWMRKLSLVVDGRTVPAEKLRTITLSDSGKETEVWLFLAGIARSATAGAELVLYAAGKEPLLRAPLKPTGGAKQEVPVELSGRSGGAGHGLLTLAILGQYQAELTVVKAE